MGLEKTECWICFEASGRRFSPCLCKGSIGSVHEKCLREWIQTSQNLHCSRCRAPYKIVCSKDVGWCWRLLLAHQWFEVVLACFTVLLLLFLYLLFLHFSCLNLLQVWRGLELLSVLVFLMTREFCQWSSRPAWRLLGQCFAEAEQDVVPGPSFSLSLLHFAYRVSRIFCSRAKRSLCLRSIRVYPLNVGPRK